MSIPDSDLVLFLRDPATIRHRSHKLLALAQDDALPHFQIDMKKLPEAANLVLELTRANYPNGEVPYHSRWRHLDGGGIDRVALIRQELKGLSDRERLRRHFELIIVSVLLDAGAGMAWRYHDQRSADTWSKSEGLAIASFEMFMAGQFSSERGDPLRIDAEKLRQISDQDLAAGFQVTHENPLAGLPGRAQLLRNVGALIVERPDIFREPRLGYFADHLIQKCGHSQHSADAAPQSARSIPAAGILAAVLEVFSPIWPSRLTVDGVNLGDVWEHSALADEEVGARLIPFHKLSQWLSYSLCEPLQECNYTIDSLDTLTGLPEYRNGGLFLDTGVLHLRDPVASQREYHASDELIVEWRGLTVALLDELAAYCRRVLNVTPEQMPLVKILQGGTWAAGRRLAQQRRADGGSPLKIVSDGTVF